MNEQRIKIADLPLFMIILWKWETVVVRFVKNFIKSTEEGCHGQVHAAMSKINSGIDQYWLGFLVAHEIPAPKVAMKQRGSLFIVEYARQFCGKIFKSNKMLCVKQVFVCCYSYLWLEPVDRDRVARGRRR